MNGREAERRDDEGLEVSRAPHIDVTLAHARRMADELVAASTRRGGRMSLAARTELAHHERAVALCEEILRLRALLDNAVPTLPETT